ncbi:hypothetical protein [Umezawaea sp. Da 62-37]|uniref:hypothetical protein n=1 Tax=Umezawaea sp. Da 62-37 TaxID=3075927 RepID=UPI0028F6E114|nr:hypothetical protein [Umezawaea sp. Da 62-37]WNV90395.1 hypothetical protein RM788_19565 [Umezawaea sp. Da 62-37]
MNWHQWQEVIAVIGVFVLLTAVITVGIWQFAVTWRAKAALAREHEYRALVERVVTAQENSERQLADLDGRLADMQSRVHSVERILKEVE